MYMNPNTLSPSAETPQPATALTPDAVFEQLRTLRSQIPEVSPLTPKQRRALRYHAVTSEPIVQASINVISTSEKVAQALDQPIGDVRNVQEESIRWKAVEDEARALLSGIAGANFIRRQKLALLGAQAYSIGTQLIRNPVNDDLVPHVLEIKRLKRLARGKKSTPANPQPSPETETKS